MTPNAYVRAAALDYAARGWRIFPLHPIVNGRCACWDSKCNDAGKHPATKWGNAVPPSPEGIEGLWSDRLGTRGIGVACGPEFGWTLDVDFRHGGAETLKRWQSVHGPLPQTRTRLTGSGSLHFDWAWPESDEIRNTTDLGAPKGEGSGIDVRGLGGYVVLAPSPHLSGSPYRSLIDMRETPAPEWLLEIVRDSKAHTGSGRSSGNGWRVDGTHEEAPLIPEGSRHRALVDFGGALRSMGLREEAMVKCGRAYVEHQCADDDPNRPIDYAHVEKTMRDMARRYPPRPNRKQGR